MTDDAEGTGVLGPEDLPAEKAVLGAMIMSAAAIAACADILRADDFVRPAHQEIFRVICDMDAEGVPVDPVILRERLAAEHVRYTGAPYLHDLMQAVPSAANAAWYAERVRDISGRRLLLRAGNEIIATAVNPEYDAAARADRAGRAVDQATRDDSEPGDELVGDFLPEFLESLESSLKTEPVRTGLGDLDSLLAGGLRPGELITFGARPGVGKSVFLLGVAAYCAIDLGRPTVLWSLEMTRTEIVQRLIASRAKVTLTRIREVGTGAVKLSDDEWDRIDRASQLIRVAPLRIDDRPYLKLPDLRASLRRMRHRGEPAALAVLDYLQLMPAERRGENRQVEVAELARGLKLMAKEFGVPVLGASQLNRGPETRNGKRPMLSDLRESGAVEQDSDIVILGHREDLYDPETPHAGEIDLIVAKHRGGPTATITATFHGHLSKIADMARV